MTIPLGELTGLLDQSRRRLNDAQDAIRDALVAIGVAERSIATLEAGDASVRPVAGISEVERDILIKGVLAALDPAAQPANRELLALDPDGEGFRIGRRRLSLSASERTILRVLWDARDEPVSRDEIAAVLYGNAPVANSRSVDVFMTSLRRKLRTAGNGFEPIQTVRGQGWRLASELCLDLPASDNSEHEARSA